MYRTYEKLMEYTIRTAINGIIYFFRRLPIIKNKVADNSYRYSSFKNLVVKVLPVLNLIVVFFKETLSLVLLGAISFGLAQFVRLAGIEPTARTVFTILIAFFISNIVNYEMKDNQLKILNMFDYFHMDPASLIKSRMFFEEGFKTVARILGFLLLGLFFELTIAFSIILPIAVFSLGILSNVLFTMLTHRGHYIPSPWTWFFISVCVAAMTLALFSVFNMDPVTVFSHPLWLLLIIPAMAASRWLMGYRHYQDDFVQYVLPKASELRAGTDVKAVQMESLALKDSDLSSKHSTALEKYQGYQLLNNLFFQRHRRLLFRPILIKVAIVGIAMLLAIGGILYMKFLRPDLIDDLPEVLTNMLPGLIPFFGYMFFTHDKISRVMFLNCDLAFLEYGFYRRSPDLLKMFALRLIKLIKYNALIAAVLVAGFITIQLLLDIPFRDFLPIIIQVLALMVFFSVHTLFTYYMFQPYTSDMTVKNPFFFLSNTAVYLVCFLTLQLDLEGPMVAFVFIGAALVYSVVALILVYKKAPKRFKIVE